MVAEEEKVWPPKVGPNRYAARNQQEIPFHGIGGKQLDGENWIRELQREAREEIGLPLNITASARTR